MNSVTYVFVDDRHIEPLGEGKFVLCCFQSALLLVFVLLTPMVTKFLLLLMGSKPVCLVYHLLALNPISKTLPNFYPRIATLNGLN